MMPDALGWSFLMSQPIILLCNDDGYYARGHEKLREALSPLGRVISVAPDKDNSGVSHKVSIHTPLRLTEISDDTWIVNGTPVDCVILGHHVVLKDQRPTLLISGINRGYNLGGDVTYSGTLGAAREGFNRGIPSMAISTAGNDGNFSYDHAAGVAARLAELHLNGADFLHKALWNVNVPPVDVLKGIRLTRLDERSFQSSVVQRLDPRGEPYFWLDGFYPKEAESEDTDYGACLAGYVSMTPLEKRRINRAVLDEYQLSDLFKNLEI